MDVIDMVRIDKELLNAEDYLKLMQDDPGAIKRTRIVPARLGEAGFGKIEVTYKAAKYVVGD